MLAQVDADGFQAAQVQILNVVRRGLEDDLILKMFVEAVGIFAVASVGGPTRGLDVSDAVGSGAEDAEKGFRVHGAGADFGVVGLLEDAALAIPIVHQLQDELLESEAGSLGLRLKFYFSWHVLSSSDACHTSMHKI